MNRFERARAWLAGKIAPRPFASMSPALALPGGGSLDFDLPLYGGELEPAAMNRRAEATAATGARRQDLRESMMSLGAGFGLDFDDYQFRRLTSGAKFQRRDLSPLQQDRMLEVTWYLWEQNPFARRLVTLMTDLILGEGVNVEAGDERVKAQLDLTWNHPANVLKGRIREFHNFLSLAGELIIPVVPNPVTGRPVLGFIDPYMVKSVNPDPMSVLIADTLTLKGDVNSGVGLEGQTLKIIRVNPGTNRLEGDCFFFRINGLPNSLRGRSDLLPLADWLDLYDQYMFGEVERLNLLSSFVWDYKIDGADDRKIEEKLAKFPTPKPGMIFAHNEKEELQARTPDLKAADRSEIARLLRLHIAGTMGFPLSYLGDIDANHATVDAQNDVMLKTPTARQKEFAGILGTIVEFIVQSTTAKNPALFRGANLNYEIRVPEIASKDIARVGQVLASVVAANDTAMSNRTMSRRGAVTLQAALCAHLGAKFDPQEMMDEADQDAQDQQQQDDKRQADLMRQARRAGQTNPPAANTAGVPPAQVPPPNQRVAA